MLEDTALIEYRVKYLDPVSIVHAEAGETAYALESVNHGIYPNTAEEEEKLKGLTASRHTLGFEFDTERDFIPYVLKTYDADKALNAEYCYGEHQPSGKCYTEQCKFLAREKVLCLIHEGYDAVIPGIIVGPLTEEYLRRLFDTDPEMQVGYSSADEVVEKWADWNWDSVIVRPLVRLRNDWAEMCETVIINRVYLFPYKIFDL